MQRLPVEHHGKGNQAKTADPKKMRELGPEGLRSRSLGTLELGQARTSKQANADQMAATCHNWLAVQLSSQCQYQQQQLKGRSSS